MSAPTEVHKLARGMGRLIRTTSNSAWLWQRWDRRQKKWVSTRTNEYNRSRAEQIVYQQAAIQGGNRNASRHARILFDSIAEEYLTARREGRDCKKLRPSSLLKAQTAINAFKSFMKEGYQSLTVAGIDATLLQEFRGNEKDRLSAGAASRNVNYILSILDFARDLDLIAETPKLNGTIHDEHENENGCGVTGSAVPSVNEIRQILDAAKVKKIAADRTTGHGRPVYDGINANDYSDLFKVLCYTGMRIGEAIHLTWDDVVWDSGVILIRPGTKNGTFWTPKTKHGNRRIAIVPELLEILHRLKQSNRKNHWVFETKRGTRLHPCNVQKRFRDICDGLKFEKRFTVHSLRKYWASTVAQQGMPWQVMIKMFGHGDFKLILESYYAQNDDARLVAEAGKIDFGLNEKSKDKGSDGESDG